MDGERDDPLSASLEFGRATSPRAVEASALEGDLAPVIAHAAHLSEDESVAGDQRLLVVLQAVNAGGKDGTIAEIVGVLHRSSMRVERFRKPPEGTSWQEVLLRALTIAPDAGELVIFNRSYYEELLRAVLDGHDDRDVVAEAILRLEGDLAERGTVVLKVFLHIDRDEQRRRLDLRQADPGLRHLHNPADYDDQQRWDSLMAAYDTVLALTHTSANPWHVVPANRRLVRNLLVAELLRPHLKPIPAGSARPRPVLHPPGGCTTEPDL